jgi:hypothetical protein
MSTRTVPNSAVEVLPKSRLRVSWIIQNEDTTDSVFLKYELNTDLNVSSTNHDHRLGPGASLAFNELMDGKEQVQGRWTAVASANTPRISVIESENIIR